MELELIHNRYLYYQTCFIPYVKELNELTKDNFGNSLLGLIIGELQKTTKHVEGSSHGEQLSTLVKFYRLISNSMPCSYRSRSGITVHNDVRGFCEDLSYEYDDGIIGNVCLFLEKQLWEVIYSIFMGSYRSASISLRHMLQLSCWTAQSVVNKKILTKRSQDCNKAMSVSEFETFLYENEKLYSTKSNEGFIATNRNTSLEGISLCSLSDDFPLQLITRDGLEGRDAISKLYGGLSGYAHVNNWQRVKIGAGRSEFLPTHTKSDFHKCLQLILETHRIIFSLLILSGLHELEYYSKSRAYNFVKNIRSESGKYKVRFCEISSILERLVQKFDEKEIEEDEKRLEELEDRMLDGEDICTDCEEFLYGEKDCKACEHLKFMYFMNNRLRS